jgi:YVTN family beta-propeller protein
MIIRRSALALGVSALLLGASRAEGPKGTLVASNMRDNTATVIDVATGRVLATLPTGEAPHEVATSHDGRWAVVSNYGVRERPGNSLTVIDVAAPAVARTIDLGDYRRPHGVKFLPGDSMLAVTSEANRAVLLVDFRSGRVVATVPTSGRGSHMLATSLSAEEAFTTNIPDGSISRLDLAKRETRSVIPVAKYVEGIAITPDGRQVWVGSNGDSIVVIVDVTAGHAADTLRGFGMPYRLAVSNDGSSAVITDPVRAEVRVYDAKTHHQRFLIPIARDSLVPTAEVAGSPSPEGVTIAPDGRWAFVTLQGRNRVATIDLHNGRIVGIAPTGTWSDGVAYSPLEHGR